MKKPPPFYDRQRFERAIDLHLEQCYAEKRPARARDFARALGMTPEHASVLARELLGKSLIDCFREKQVAYAAELLRRTPLPVEEIAEWAGFGTASTLHRVFARVMGTTPRAFRILRNATG